MTHLTVLNMRDLCGFQEIYFQFNDEHKQSADDDKDENEELGEDMTVRENVFMSMVQDFGMKGKKEIWVSVGEICSSNQICIILKGIGTHTNRYLQDDEEDTEDIKMKQFYVRKCLVGLQRSRLDNMEEKDNQDPTFQGCTTSVQSRFAVDLALGPMSRQDQPRPDQLASGLRSNRDRFIELEPWTDQTGPIEILSRTETDRSNQIGPTILQYERSFNGLCVMLQTIRRSKGY